MTFQDKVVNVASRAGLKVMVKNPNYIQCSFDLGGGRSQVVHLAPVGDLVGQTVVQISTPVKELPSEPLPAQFADKLLCANGGFKIGCFGIQESLGRRVLMFSHNMILDTLDPEEFKVVVLALAATGDDWEAKLGGEDRF